LNSQRSVLVDFNLQHDKPIVSNNIRSSFTGFPNQQEPSAEGIRVGLYLLAEVVKNWNKTSKHQHSQECKNRHRQRSFVLSDIVITISYERLEQFWQSWQGIFTSNQWWPG